MERIEDDGREPKPDKRDLVKLKLWAEHLANGKCFVEVHICIHKVFPWLRRQLAQVKNQEVCSEAMLQLDTFPLQGKQS